MVRVLVKESSAVTDAWYSSKLAVAASTVRSHERILFSRHGETTPLARDGQNM